MVTNSEHQGTLNPEQDLDPKLVEAVQNAVRDGWPSRTFLVLGVILGVILGLVLGAFMRSLKSEGMLNERHQSAFQIDANIVMPHGNGNYSLIIKRDGPDDSELMDMPESVKNRMPSKTVCICEVYEAHFDKVIIKEIAKTKELIRVFGNYDTDRREWVGTFCVHSINEMFPGQS